MPRENVFGLSIDVQPRMNLLGEIAESDQPLIIAVSRCVDLPRHEVPEPFRSRNVQTPCDNCREICWLDPKHAIPGVRISCMHCLPPEYEIAASTEQVAEVRSVMGLNGPEW